MTLSSKAVVVETVEAAVPATVGYLAAFDASAENTGCTPARVKPLTHGEFLRTAMNEAVVRWMFSPLASLVGEQPSLVRSGRVFAAACGFGNLRLAQIEDDNETIEAMVVIGSSSTGDERAKAFASRKDRGWM